MRRPLACTALMFVVVLLVLELGNATGIVKNPVVGTADKLPVLDGYEQGEGIIVCGKITDYSQSERYGQTTTELNLNTIQIMPRNEAFTTKNSIPIHLSESDSISHLQSIGNKKQSILVYLQDTYVPVIGSYIIVSGKLSYFNKATNPGEFDAYRFYTNRGILFAVKDASVLKESTSGNRLLQALKEFRLRQEAYLEEYLPDGNDAVMKCMLFGNRKEMDEETKELYQKNGIAHILAISGLHISLLGMAVYRVFMYLPLPKWFILTLSGAFLILYCFMVGISASAFRALVMFSFFLISKWLKRSYDMITAMAFSAVVWLMLYPGYLFDCGFQLSYAAIAGIGILLPALNEIADTVKIKWLRKGILLFLPSLSVNLMTAPILIYHYYELSFFSILLNLIVLPLMAPLLLTTIGMLFMANLFGEVSMLPARLCAIPVNFILWVYEMGCRILEQLPVGRKNIAPISFGGLVLYYSILVVMTILVKKKCHLYQFVFPIVCICMLLYNRKLDFEVWMLDVGQGDCNVIFTEEGKVFVLDCGSTSMYNVGERILIPFLKYHGVGTVDGVIVSHADSDHMSGIVELAELGHEENIEVKGIYLYEQGLSDERQSWQELVGAAKDQGISVYGIGQGDILRTESLRLKCIYPLAGQRGLTGNGASLVMTLECEDFCGIFTGDLETEGERILLDAYKDTTKLFGQKECDLLKVAHHGSSTSTSNEFLQWISPRYAVISCGENNRYGHPHKEVLERLYENGIAYRITHTDGAVCYTD